MSRRSRSGKKPPAPAKERERIPSIWPQRHRNAIYVEEIEREPMSWFCYGWTVGPKGKPHETTTPAYRLDFEALASRTYCERCALRRTHFFRVLPVWINDGLTWGRTDRVPAVRTRIVGDGGQYWATTTAEEDLKRPTLLQCFGPGPHDLETDDDDYPRWLELAQMRNGPWNRVDGSWR